MKAIFKCPECGAEQEIGVPKDRCMAFHKCTACGELIPAPEDECCVVCAYSDKKCPVNRGKKV